ncbi:DUF4139 domain-containing protein [Streptomyces sp. NPDC012769]|uniref:DUF4139 domain-containing protein n=1 Tax=Streptomyces sp. NPDC012769 TaxID=3364848 RepID=UPI00367B5084
MVYAEGALCRRIARGVVPPDGRVRVTGLPRSLDPGSLRVRVLGPSGMRVTEARVEVEAEPPAAGAAEGLRREVERLRDAYAAARARRDRQAGLIEEVGGLRPVPPPRKREDPHRRTPVDAWLELADFVDARLTGLHARLTELDEALALAGHELALAEDTLARASTAAPAAHLATTVSAVLTLTAPDGPSTGPGQTRAPGTGPQAAAGPGPGAEPRPDGPRPESAPGPSAESTSGLEVELEYGVPGAVWVPGYRLTHRQGDGDGRLVLRASVAQRTGEDWTGVRIALATADLRRRTDLPQLRSIRIGRRQAAPAPSGWREPPAGLAGLFAGYDAAGPRPVTVAGGAAASGPRPITVPAGRPAVTGGASAAGPRPGPSAPAGGTTASGPRPVTPPPGYPAASGSVPPPPPPAPAVPAPVAVPPPVAPTHAGAPASLPTPGSAYGGGYGGPPEVFRQAFAGAPAPAGRPSGPGAPGAAAPAPAAPPAVAGPPRPDGAELDYASLVLSGADEPGGRRGLLFPEAPFDPVAAEYRRRAEAVAGLPLPGHAVRPRESAGSFDHRFDAAARADIPSDGTWHTVTVGEIPVGLRTEYLCVPSVEQTVYATLVLSNATDQALLAGPVEVVVDDEFLLTAALPTLAPGGVRRVGLGPAEGVRVTRRTHLAESTSGLRNTTTVLDHRVHVELANRLAGPVTVEVRERVPVTSDPDVRIEERAGWSVPEEGTEPEQHAPGTRIRRVELPAGGTAALDGGYEIRIPAGKALVGGNRRS